MRDTDEELVVPFVFLDIDHVASSHISLFQPTPISASPQLALHPDPRQTPQLQS
jgi:hypothetical protein